MAEIKDCIEILRLTSTDSEKVFNLIKELGFSDFLLTLTCTRG